MIDKNQSNIKQVEGKEGKIKEAKTPIDNNKKISQEEAERTFGEIREKHQHIQFWVVYTFSILVSFILYSLFVYFLWCDKLKNWHTGLFLILPATTILLALIQSLKYNQKSKEIKENNEITLSDFLQRIKELKSLHDIV